MDFGRKLRSARKLTSYVLHREYILHSTCGEHGCPMLFHYNLSSCHEKKALCTHHESEIFNSRSLGLCCPLNLVLLTQIDCNHHNGHYQFSMPIQTSSPAAAACGFELFHSSHPLPPVDQNFLIARRRSGEDFSPNGATLAAG